MGGRTTTVARPGRDRDDRTSRSGRPVRTSRRRGVRAARRVVVGLVGLLVLALTAACSGSSGTPGSAASPRHQGPCTLSGRGVPSCGVLWGVSTQPRTVSHLEALEQTLGRRFDFVYHYVDVDSRFPDDGERAEVAGGRLLHVAIAARYFHPAGHPPVTWAAVAAGDYDSTLLRQARGVASLRRPVFVTFSQEANAGDKLGVLGSAADFRAAWRHLHALYEQAGATNAVWTWVMTGSPNNFDRAAQLWPGNDVVDWISWNVYNQSGCQQGAPDPAKLQSFDDELRPFYDFVHERGPSFGLDPDKPMMISESGSVRYASDPSLSADWYAAIPASLAKYPQVKAVTLWDSSTRTCDYDFDGSPTTLAGVRRAGLSGVLATNGALDRH